MVIRRDPKVFRNGPFLIGYTSSFRLGQLLRFRLSVPVQQSTTTDYEFMATVFVDAVRECLGAHGAKKTESGVEEGGTFLVGYHGKLYAIHNDFQVAESSHGFNAVGSGAAYAIGAMAASDALIIAEKFNIGVRGPFVIEELSAE